MVTGSVLSNNLKAAPSVSTTPKLTMNGSDVTGTVNTAATHNFSIVGEVTTSAGKVVNTVSESTSFYNDQYWDLTSTIYAQNVNQATTTTVNVTSKAADGKSSAVRESFYYPLQLIYHQNISSAGDGTVLSTVNQQRQTARTVDNNGQPTNQATSANAIQTTDKLVVQGGSITGNTGQSSTATLLMNGTNQPCFSRTLKAAANVLTAVKTGCQ